MCTYTRATDSVFAPTADESACDAPPAFVPARPITQADLAALTERVPNRVIWWLRLNRLPGESVWPLERSPTPLAAARATFALNAGPIVASQPSSCS
jgi:hypothetical protein